MKAMSISYIAGLFDGEGSVSIIHQKSPRKNEKDHRVHVLHISIANTFRECLDYVVESMGIGKVREKPIKDMKSNWKKIFMWEARGPRAKEFLKELYPYLIIKKDRANIGIDFQTKNSKVSHKWNSDRKWQSEYCQKIRNINFEKGSAKSFRPCNDISNFPTIWNKGMKFK